MKGAKLYAAIFTPVALALGTVMAIKNWAESWSQNHSGEYDWMLNGTLICIILTFWSVRFAHPEKNREITKIFGKSYKLKHAATLTALLFCGVLMFGVNNHTELIFGITVSDLHIFFTASAIASGYMMIMTYPQSKRGHTWALIALIIGVGGFVLGYVFKLYSISWGEVWAASPIAAFMSVTWLFKKD